MISKRQVLGVTEAGGGLAGSGQTSRGWARAPSGQSPGRVAKRTEPALGLCALLRAAWAGWVAGWQRSGAGVGIIRAGGRTPRVLPRPHEGLPGAQRWGLWPKPTCLGGGPQSQGHSSTAPHFPLPELCWKGGRDGQSGWGLEVGEGSKRVMIVVFAGPVRCVLKRGRCRQRGLGKMPGCSSLLSGRKVDPRNDSCLLPWSAFPSVPSCLWGGAGRRWGLVGDSWTPSPQARASEQAGKWAGAG